MTETLTAILDAAERRIRVAGYHGFSYREVAADVGVKAASVHYYYPSKDALAAAVARRYVDRIGAAIEKATAARIGIVQAWRAVFRDALKGDGRMCLCGALGATASDLTPSVAEEVRRFFSLGIESLTAGGLTREEAIRTFALLEGAILLASSHDDLSLFETATAEMELPDAGRPVSPAGSACT